MVEKQIDIFPWSESFNLGVPLLDEQHRKLVDLLNEVARTMTSQKSVDGLDVLINKMVDYAEFHFDAEEEFWKQKLPESRQITDHQNNHMAFIQKANYLLEKMEAQDTDQDWWIEELLSFLVNWLITHILESDKHMVLLVKALEDGKTLDEAQLWAQSNVYRGSKDTIKVILNSCKTLTRNTIQLMREIRIRTETADKLFESETLLQQAMDYAKIGRWSLPYKSEEAQWSAQMYKIFGISKDKIPSPETLCGIMQDGFQNTFIDSITNTFATGQEHRVEYQIVRPIDGLSRWIECRGKLISNDDGTPNKISGFIQDITERKNSESKVIQLAYFDALTGLPNRRLLLDRLEQIVVMSEREDSYAALVFIDLDDFKDVNDSHGHEYGDALLQQAAKRVQELIRKGDTLARIGGDEFLLVLTKLDKDKYTATNATKNIINKVLNVLSSPFRINSVDFNSSASIGVRLFNDNSESVSELMGQADIAMYSAKHSGKNSASFYSPDMQSEITQRVELERDLRAAVEFNEFELYYQPQVNHQNKVTGLEALIRWHHPIKGLVPPNDFIHSAENNGLIIPIGDWVLRKACEQLSVWANNQSTETLTISVNVSYRQFRQPGFIFSVSSIIERYSFNPARLKIELTETMLVDDMERTVACMNKLKQYGVQLSLDDFGTGYSSLQYLKLLPLNQLKIDRSFVSELETEVNDRSIVKTIILMSRTLGIEVIAEGVETEHQRSYLIKHGCSLFQGFHFGKPMPLSELSAWLENYSNEHNK
ncbi:bacteriohemerythrin [Alginatibacterium sediminis]|uniref:bacteriohemerythrin n=1 Tax=Alginatibacterium sediminis TaxID=2164068 RepID=UPI001314F8EF|nr:bacteriohemerythrin [Alginatibacterium sediminis]